MPEVIDGTHDFWHVPVMACHLYGGSMRRFSAESAAGALSFVVALAVGSPVFLGWVDPVIPMWWWATAYVVTVVGLFGSSIASVVRGSLAVNLFLLAMVASWVVVLGAHHMGLLAILVVLISGMVPYLLPERLTVVVVLLNTAVLVVMQVLSSADAQEIVMVTAVYLLLQWGSIYAGRALLREKAMRADLAQAHVELRSASVLLSQSARNAERLRISRDLHDALGHQLTVLNLELEAARHRDPLDAGPHIARASGIGRALLGDVRAAVGSMRHERGELEATLVELAADVPGLTVHVAVEPGVRVGESESIVMIRAVQEIVTNALRHAGARELWVEVATNEQGQLTLRANDDGATAPSWRPGNGLRGLVERFESLGGHAQFGPGPHGFEVTGWVPLSERAT